MIKRFLILSLLVFLIMAESIHARIRTENEALKLAADFFSTAGFKTSNIKRDNQFLSLAYSGKSKNKQNMEDALYYVFNRGVNDGFIIIGGNDQTKEILGYTEEGNFDINTIPDNFKYWLSCYEEEIALIGLNKSNNLFVQPDDPFMRGIRSAYTASIAPLIKTKWNQLEPYNLLCPNIPSTNEKTVTGCVATGMAQVMNYYKYPAKGVGSNSYTTSTHKIPLNVTFSSTTYDWSNMSNLYNSMSTSDEKNAVATLMYHCGVSCNMNYGLTSGAFTKDMARAFVKNFTYDSNLQYHLRYYYTKAEWESLIKNELNSLRPVVYAGSSTNGAHLFICDGYDSNGLFHINWGWGGMSDGYFELSALSPGSLGTGGGDGGYNFNQEIVVGIQKPNSKSKSSYLFCFDKPLTVSPMTGNFNTEFTASVENVFNKGISDFSGEIGIAFCDEQGQIKYHMSKFIEECKSGYGWKLFDYKVGFNSFANGNYKMYWVCKGTDQDSWSLIRGKAGTLNHFDVQVSNSGIVFSVPQDIYPQLSLNKIELTGKFYTSKTGRFKISITNSGQDYNSILQFILKSKTTGKTTYLSDLEFATIGSGETKELQFVKEINAIPGEYTLHVYSDINNNVTGSYLTQLGSSIDVTVHSAPIQESIMTLLSKISFPDPENVDKNNAVLTAKIKNTGGLFDNKLIAFIFPVNNGSSLTYFGYQHAVIDQNEEQEITFSGQIDLEPNKYQVAIYWSDKNSDWKSFTPVSNSVLSFTLEDNVASVVDITKHQLSIFPNPTAEHLFFQSDQYVKTFTIFDLFGKEIIKIYPNSSGIVNISVSELNSGIYVFQAETYTGISTGKFIKQ